MCKHLDTSTTKKRKENNKRLAILESNSFFIFGIRAKNQLNFEFFFSEIKASTFKLTGDALAQRSTSELRTKEFGTFDAKNGAIGAMNKQVLDIDY